jgi:hypothetical protein
MSDGSFREFKLSGGALINKRKRQTTTRKNRQYGGDNSGALIQLANQSAPAFTEDLNAQKIASEFGSQVGKVLSNDFGPSKIQQSGGKKQNGGNSTGAIVNLSSTRSTTTPGAPNAVPTVSGISPSQPAPVGGSRLVLKEPKRKTRIALKAKKSHGGSDSGKSNVPPMPSISGGSTTRKARKIHLRVKGVTSRLAKAKKAKRTAMSAPISIVKSRLESAGVVKKGSKAPEAMMRTMYADLLITKKGL